MSTPQANTPASGSYPPTGGSTLTTQPVVVSPVKDATPIGLTSPILEFTPMGLHSDFVIQEFNASVQCSLGSAFVELRMLFSAQRTDKNAVFLLPTKPTTTVTDVKVNVGTSKFVRVEIVPNTDLASLKGNENFTSQRRAYTPDEFRISIGPVKTLEPVSVTVKYFEELYFENGMYQFTLPCQLPPGQPALGHVFRMNLVINTGTHASEWGEASHPLVTTSQHVGHIELESDTSNMDALPNTEFSISYTLADNNILSAVLWEPGLENRQYDPRDTFAVILTPPRLLETVFPRAMVFLIDRSGSMNGDPMDAAKRAVSAGLENLNPFDVFNIVAFDHEQAPWRTELVEATPENIEQAKGWVATIQARGGTDIDTPLIMAIEIIENAPQLPFILLLTDGCVANEREVCLAAEAKAQRTRISTFGIGPFCNYYFLKLLATIGRGFSDRALRHEHIFPQMTRLLQRSSQPVLTDIAIGIGELPGLEVYPFPIPDLFNGAPLIVSGKLLAAGPHSPGLPESIVIQGRLPDGSEYAVTQPVQPAYPMNLHSVFIKQNLDLLTARAWLTEDNELKQRAIDMSMNEGMVCAYTTMVCYQAKGDNDASKRKGKRGANLVAAAAIGSVAVVGAALLGFGSLGGTMMNLPVGNVMQSLGDANPFTIGVGDGADCCGECQCDCDNCDSFMVACDSC